MNDFDDPLDLLDDDGDGVIEMCLLEKEEKQTKRKEIKCLEKVLLSLKNRTLYCLFRVSYIRTEGRLWF